MGKEPTFKAAYAQAQQEFPAGFSPKPTVFPGGLNRMKDLWNKARDVNHGGYGGGRLFKVRGYSGVSDVTSCSPFTATIVGMMFDPDGGTDKKEWEPKYDNGQTPLGVGGVFYTMHNGDFCKHMIGAARKKWFDENKWHQNEKDYLGNKVPGGASWVDDSAHSLVWYGLGYEIDPRDMRRGDMVGIDWVSGGGHATFCWDVHLNDKGEVDCFVFLSSNSPLNYGVCVSTWPRGLTVEKSGNKYKAIDAPIFEDKSDNRYVTNAEWLCLPHVKSTEIKCETFKAWPVWVKGKDNYGKYAINHLRVTRFWGFPPPDSPHGTLLGDNAGLAKQLAKHGAQPEPFSKGTCEKPGKGKVSTKPVKKSNPEPKKAVSADAKQQKKEEALPHQMQVEAGLLELFRAKWIDKDPGKPDSIADSQSKAAIEDFQAKFKVEGEPGSAGPKTRDALEKALADLHAGKPNPNDKTERKPSLDQYYWSPNTVEPGGSTKLGVMGKNLDLVKSWQVIITDKKSGASETVTIRIVAKNGVAGSESVKIPAKFTAGSTLSIRLSAEGIDKQSEVPLYVAKPPEKQKDWPWDETKWPSHVRDIVNQLRSTPKGRGNYQQRHITQYGVWDRVSDGDTAVLNTKGKTIGHTDKKSLYLADLEGTMRLGGKILNLASSGNVFDSMGKASFDKFDPKKSKWIDVCADAPWGMGAKMPLVPFRTLAHNAAKESGLYGRKVYVEQLAGMKMPNGETHNGVCIIGDAGGMEAGKQFELFVGPEGGRIALPAQCNVEIL